MKKLLFLICIGLSSFTGFSSSTWPYFPGACLDLIGIDTSMGTLELTKKIARLNKVSRGDTGECSDREACLQPYLEIILDFDCLYSDSTLIEIVQSDFCPVVSCYAFSAIVCQPDSSISEQTILDLALPFAHQKTSLVTLDWGCGWHDIQVYDYIISLISGKYLYLANFLPEIRSFTSKTIRKLLDEREPYYNGEDSFSRKKTWDEYRNSFL